MSAPHTPGPWRAANPNEGWQIARVGVPGYFFSERRVGCRISAEEMAANANVIAAAPAMLSELVDTDETLTKLITDLEGVVIAAHLEILIAWQRSVRATINQARGI